jgi:hypothetical protein
MGLTCSPLHFGFPGVLPSAQPGDKVQLPIASPPLWSPLPPFFIRVGPISSPFIFSLPRRPSVRAPCLPSESRCPSLESRCPSSDRADTSRPDDSLLLPAFQQNPNTPARLTRLGGDNKTERQPRNAKNLLNAIGYQKSASKIVAGLARPG